MVVDGNDVEAVHGAVREAVDRARSGGGPTLVEARTMRMLGHAIHDGAEYVPEDLLAAWSARDPVALFREKLAREGVAIAELDAIGRRCDAEIDEAIAFAEASPWPTPESVTDDVYAP